MEEKMKKMYQNMYQNVGKKIMTLAKVCGWICLIAGIISWFIFLCNDYSFDNYMGWISLLGGILSFVSSWMLYGFGQMVDDVNAMRKGAENTAEAAPSEELPEL